MLFGLLVLYNILIITGADQRISKVNAKDRSINLALETVLEFNNKNNADVNMLDNVGKIIDKVKMAINKNKKLKHIYKDISTFSSFIQSMVKILNKYDDRSLQNFVSVLNSEIRNYHYEGNKFHELTENNNIRRILNTNFSLLKNLATNTRRIFKAMANNLEKGIYHKKLKEVIDFIDSLYGRDYVTKYYDLLLNLDAYRFNKSNDINLVKTVKDGIRSLIFDHYSQLNESSRNALISKISDMIDYAITVYTKLPQSSKSVEFKHRLVIRPTKSEKDRIKFRQMHEREKIDSKYDFTKTKVEYYKQNDTYSSKLFITRKSGTDLSKTHIPTSKINKKYKASNMGFKKFGFQKVRDSFKTTEVLRTFRQIYVEKNLDLKYNPYAYDHLTAKTESKPKKLTFPTLYPTFEPTQQLIQLAVSKRQFTDNLREFTKRLYKIDKNTSRNVKAIQIKEENNTPEKLPVLKKHGPVQKHKMVRLNKYNKYLKKLKLLAHTPKISLRESTRLMPILKQESKKKLNISNVEYLDNSRKQYKLLSKNKIEDSYLTSSGVSFNEGYSIEETMQVIHKRPSRRHFIYDTTVTTAIHYEVMQQLQKLEYELKLIKTRLENDTRAKKVMSNNSFNHSSEFLYKEYIFDEKGNAASKIHEIKHKDTIRDKVKKMRVRKNKENPYNDGFTSREKILNFSYNQNFIEHGENSQSKNEIKSIMKVNPNESKVEHYKGHKSNLITLQMANNHNANESHKNAGKNFMTAMNMLQNKKAGNNVGEYIFPNYFRSILDSKDPFENVYVHKTERVNNSDFQRLQDTTKMSISKMYTTFDVPKDNNFTKVFKKDYEKVPKVLIMAENKANETSFFNKDKNNKNTFDNTLFQKNLDKIFDSSGDQLTSLNLTENMRFRTAIPLKNISLSSKFTSNVTEMDFNKNHKFDMVNDERLRNEKQESSLDPLDATTALQESIITTPFLSAFTIKSTVTLRKDAKIYEGSLKQGKVTQIELKVDNVSLNRAEERNNNKTIVP